MLRSLQAAVGASTNFSGASQLTFENTNFPSLKGYQQVIQTVGGLSEWYSSTFERGIATCERIIENNRTIVQQIVQIMRSVISKVTANI